MAEDDHKRDEEEDQKHPIDPPVAENERYRLDRSGKEHGHPTDVGRTMGGGSLGHTQPERVEREAPARNNADDRKTDEPTMPSKESSLNTKV
jgi:hypothetical protein